MTYCLVCMQDRNFIVDDDCLRCEECMCLPYTKEDDIVKGHREEYLNRWSKENDE